MNGKTFATLAMAAALAALSLWLSLDGARAEGPFVFGIQPSSGSSVSTASRPYFTFQLEPGGHAQDSLTIVNNGDSPITLKLYAADGVTAINGSTAFASSGETRSSVHTWLSTDVTDIALSPGQVANLPFHVEVPADARPGDHVAGWVVEAPPKPGSSGGFAASVVERAGVAVVIRLPGPTQQALVLGGTCLNQETGSNYFETGVRNDGNVLTTGSGSLTLARKGSGEEVFSRPAELGNVVPKDGTLMRLDAPFDPGPGEYVATVRLSQPDGRMVESRSEITITEKKTNGCVAVAPAQDVPQRGIPLLGELPGGGTPWLVMFALAAILVMLLAVREYVIRRRLRTLGVNADDEM